VCRWFHGFLSSIEAERFLERQPPGTFLIRFSKSKPGSFAIAYVDANNRNAVTHTLITCAPPSGFKIEEAYNRSAKGRLFVTLNEIVEFYSYILKIPFRSDLSRQRYIQCYEIELMHLQQLVPWRSFSTRSTRVAPRRTRWLFSV
jgi:hypothetical protein